VELAEYRHMLATSAVEVLQNLVPHSLLSKSDQNRTVSLHTKTGLHLELSQNDLLALPLSGLTLVYAASLCFPQHLMLSLASKLALELQPGALFWTLAKLPAGQHPGLALVMVAPGAATWDPGAKVFIYMRILQLSLPPLPSGVGTEEPGDPGRSRDLLSAWALQLLQAARAELEHIANESGTILSREDYVLPGEAFLSVAPSLGVVSPLAGHRLLRAFGMPRDRTVDNICGCGEGQNSSLSLSDIGLLGMLGHGHFPDQSLAESINCFSSSGSCSFADLFAERVFFEVRRKTLCRGPSPPFSCRRPSVSGTLSSDPGITKGLVCTRLSDGRSLLHVAVMSRSPGVANSILKSIGTSGFFCSDHKGQSALHVASALSSKNMTYWILENLQKTPVDFRRTVLAQRDFIARLPQNLTQDPAVLELLNAAMDWKDVGTS